MRISSFRFCVLTLTLIYLAGSRVAAQATCTAQFIAAAQKSPRNLTGFANFIDPETPASACSKSLCSGDYATCDPIANRGKTIPKTDYVLVYSDEFNEPKRKFGVMEDDRSWTAEDMYYFPTGDIEVYKPDQASTQNGSLVLTITRCTKPEKAKTQQPTGQVWDVAKNYKSALLSGWNKFCFTGGYMEMNVKFPGNAYVSTFWPAFWAMGNLGRQGYMKSTNGMWPYSYTQCGLGSTMNTSQPGSKVPSQLISACPDPPNFNRTAFGFEQGVGRAAPEFDVFEGSTAYGAAVSQTLQMAPLLPEGTTWDDLQWYDKQKIPAGVNLPGGPTLRQTELNGWDGTFDRPGNEFQDSYSGVSKLNQSFFETYHTFGVDWQPGEYLRWYIDGEFLYEVNKNALVQQTGPNGVTIGERIIPIEPMYMIINLGLSNSFGYVDIKNLPFPAYMMVDWVRVWQHPDQMNVGCSPKDMPTEQWIACHSDYYMTNNRDMRLIKTKCNATGNANGIVSGAVGVQTQQRWLTVLVTVIVGSCIGLLL